MKSPSIKSTFAVHEVCALTGFSKYMLDYLVRDGIYAPSTTMSIRGRGVRRQYTYVDVVVLRALNHICKEAGRVRYLRPALEEVRRRYGGVRPGDRLDEMLVAYDGTLHVRTNEGTLRDPITGQLAFSFFVDMAQVTKVLADKVIVVDRERSTFQLSQSTAEEAEIIRQKYWEKTRQKRELSA